MDMLPAESDGEADLQLLETDLDGALDAGEADVLSRRLAAEPELARLRAQLLAARAVRRDVFRSLEPDDTAVDRFAWRLAGATAEHRFADAFHQQQSKRIDPWQLTRWCTAAAACLLFGFFAGRGVRPTTVVAPPADSASSAVALQSPTPGSNTLMPMVPVSNENGQVVAWQPFRSTDDARSFAEDLNRARLPEQPSPGDNVKLMADEKF